jgi:hypothetical protein
LQSLESSLGKQFAGEKQKMEEKVAFLMEKIDSKEAAIQEKEKKIQALTQERDELAADYFAIIDENVALEEKLESARK